VRLLFVTDEPPWPPRSGYQLRMSQILDALSELGEVDLAVTIGTRRLPGSAIADRRFIRMVELPVRGVGGRASVATRWLTSRDPRLLLRSDWTAAARELQSWMRPRYDVAWFSHVPVHRALGHVVDAPSIVDLDDLHGVVLAHRSNPRGVLRRPHRRWVRATGVDRVTQLTDHFDRRRWHDLDLRTASTATAVVVCSELDRSRLGAPNAAVVPNGYPRPARPVRATPARPTLTMIGKLVYEPNLDGAHAFVEHVLPLVRASIPDVEFRLIGKYSRPDDVSWLAEQPGVTVLGEVPDVAAELARSSVVVVPLRYGGGTRIKILEAFAYGRAVVSTSVGAEGLAVVDGRDLAVADTVEGFAAACVRLLGDEAARDTLARGGRRLYDATYATDRIRPVVAELAHAVSASGAPSVRAVAEGGSA
jgi:glycosyltransferase involved in cell wall biosynthesis